MAQHLSSRRQIDVVCADITRCCSVEIVGHCVLDTDDITKRSIETGSAFPDPALFQFRFTGRLRRYRESFRRFTAFFYDIRESV